VKVLVSGAAGQVGRCLLATRPPEIEVIAFSHAELDIGDARAVSEAITGLRPDLIVNAAAYTAVDKAESEPELARRINTEGPRHLAQAAERGNARLIHLSSDFVFDGTASSPHRPEAPTNPLSVYGRTKRDGELAVLESLPYRSTVVRTAWVYAAEGRNFVRTLLRLMRAEGAVRVVADQVGTPTAAPFLAQALWRIARTPEILGIHHWTDAGVASWYDFAVAIAEEGAALGLLPETVEVAPISSAEYPSPARRPAYSVLDKHSLMARGFAPEHWRKRLRTVLREIPRG
jgi:dTDP-4-dehydrorhamnose reductase